MRSDFEEQRKTLVDNILGVARSHGDPAFVLSVALAMDQNISVKDISKGLHVAEGKVRSVVEDLSEAKTLEVYRPGTGFNDSKQVEYRLPLEVQQHPEFWESIFGPRYLVTTDPLPDEAVAAAMAAVEPRMRFSYTKFCNGYRGSDVQRAFAPYAARFAALQREMHEAFHRELDIDPGWKGLPELVQPVHDNVQPDGHYLIHAFGEMGQLRASFSSPEEAIDAKFDRAEGVGTLLSPRLKGKSKFSTETLLYVERKAEGFVLTLHNQREIAALPHTALPLPYSYQRALAQEQDVLVESLSKALDSTGIKASVH